MTRSETETLAHDAALGELSAHEPVLNKSAVVAVLLASALLPFAVTGPAVVLPAMARSLEASATATQWIQDSYNTAFAAGVLGSGALADRFGRRLVLRVGIAGFALLSFLIAVAPNAIWVDAGRVVQGLGAAGIISAGAAVLAHATSGRLRTVVFGLLGASFGTGLALAPLAAGLLSGIGWQAVFYAMAAIAIVALVASARVTESESPTTGRIDVFGILTFAGAVTLLSFGFVVAGSGGWLSATALASFGGFAVLLSGFAWWELRQSAPLFNVRLFTRAAFTAVICQPFVVTFGFVILLVFLPVYLQGASNVTPLASAAELLPMTLPVLVLPLLAEKLTARLSLRAILVGSALLISAGSFGLLVLAPGADAVRLGPPLLVFGVGVGAAFAVMDNAAVGTVPVHQAGTAAGMFNTMRIAGESLAIAAAGALLATLTAAHVGTDESEPAMRGQHLNAAVASALTGAWHIVVILLGVMALIGGAVTAVALRETPSVTSNTDADGGPLTGLPSSAR